jgi:hypothetical protein
VPLHDAQLALVVGDTSVPHAFIVVVLASWFDTPHTSPLGTHAAT